MAINLKAVFSVQDNGTSRLRKIMQQTEKLSKSTKQATKATDSFRDANGRLRDAMGRFVSESNRASNANSRFATSLSGVRVGASNASASLSGMQSSLMGIVGAYATAEGAAAAFNATIGAAAKFQQQEVVTTTMFRDEGKASEYLKMIEEMAVQSAVLNSNDMMTGSKAYVGLTKDMDQLRELWKITEKLQAFSGVDTQQASFSLKELMQGDAVSFNEVIGLDTKRMREIAKMSSVTEKIAAVNKVLSKAGVTDDTTAKMAKTTLGQWSAITEKAQLFMRTIGDEPNSSLSKHLASVSDSMDKIFTSDFAAKIGDGLTKVLNVAVDVGKFMWKWKEPLAYVAGAITATLGAFAVIGTISALANPITLIAAGIAAVAVGFKALYDNSEPFRNVIDGLVGKAKELFSAFQNGGTGGLLDSLFGEGTAEKVVGIVDTVKTKFGEMKSGFDIVKNALSQGWQVISDIFTSAWTIISPILSALWSVLQVIGDIAVIVFNSVIAPALQFITQLFTTLWAVAQPILTLIGSMLKLTGSIVKWLWDTILAPFVEFILGGLKNAFDNFSDALSVVAGWFETIGNWANTAKDYIGKFADMIAGIKLPDWVTSGISTVVSTVGKVIGAKSDGSHFHGLERVPYDGYLATLHRNEMVLTAKEADAYRQMMTNKRDVANVVNPTTVSPIMPQTAPAVNNVLEPIINVTVNQTPNVFNQVAVSPTPINVGGEEVTNDYSYERVSNSIANQTTNNTYNNTTNQTTNNGVSGNKTQSQRPITINMGGVTVREEADIDKIGWMLFDRLQKAEGAGV